MQSGKDLFVVSCFYLKINAANHTEIWRIATSMDDRKSEIENWDLGAGIYMSFYLLKSSLEEDADTMVELVRLLISLSNCLNFNQAVVDQTDCKISNFLY